MTETTTKTRKSRKQQERIPFGVPRKKLSLNARSIPGYVCRFINDDESRLMAALDGGYQFVYEDELGIEDRRKELGTTDQTDGRVCRLVGKKENGNPQFAYLMKIKEELYEEDQQMKREYDNKIIENQMKGTGVERVYAKDVHGITRS